MRRTALRRRGGHRMKNSVLLEFREFCRHRRCEIDNPDCRYRVRFVDDRMISISDPAHYHAKNHHGDKLNICSLCDHHHRQQHRIGWPAFQALHNIDAEERCAVAWDEYTNGEEFAA